jgi:MFS transporter, ACS family, allantoate permease
MADEEKVDLDKEVAQDLPSPLAEAMKEGRVPDKILKHSHDADEAMKAFMGHEGQILEIDEATNKRILRIIDRNLLPASTSLS